MSARLPVLIVNDDENIHDSIVKIANDGGYNFRNAKTGKDALWEASRYDFSLAIIDLDLPDMTGDEFYDQLQEKESHYNLPIVTFIDSLDSKEVTALNKLLPKGPITILSKPIDQDQLTALFERYASQA